MPQQRIHHATLPCSRLVVIVYLSKNNSNIFNWQPKLTLYERNKWNRQKTRFTDSILLHKYKKNSVTAWMNLLPNAFGIHFSCLNLFRSFLATSSSIHIMLTIVHYTADICCTFTLNHGSSPLMMALRLSEEK